MWDKMLAKIISMTKKEKAIAIAVGLFAVAVYGLIVYLAIFPPHVEKVSQKWQSAGEECIRSLERCVRGRKMSRGE